jgi:hypothetical protein
MTSRRIGAVLRGELLCGGCGIRPPRTPAHGRCWECSRGGGQPAPPCRDCGGEHWISGWCRACHPYLKRLARSCQTCLAWGALNAPTCQACYGFARTHPVGRCLGCDRDVPVNTGYCRLCRHQARMLAGPDKYAPSELDTVAHTGQQLFLANTQRTLWLHNTGVTTTAEPLHRDAHSAAGPWHLPHFPIHQELFALPTEVTPPRILHGDAPRASWFAHLAPAADRLAEAKGWTGHVRDAVAVTVEALVATQPAGTPLYRASAVARLSGNHRNVTRTLEVLGELGMIEEDRGDRLELWVHQRVKALPEAIRADVVAWAGILRHGDRRHHPKHELTWRHYLLQVVPTLLEWSRGCDSLREITRDHVIAVLEAPSTRAGDDHGRLTALRSLFRYLKASKRIFVDPTARLPRTLTRRPKLAIPTRLPTTAVSQIGASAHDPAQWLVIVLTGHHALGAVHILALALDDVDLAGRRLHVGSGTRPLDTLTAQAIERYLAYRNRRWPYTGNPHLLINQQSAHHDRPVGRTWIRQAVRGQAVSLDQLRQDRILDEAEAIGVRDPLHISAMFDLHPDTAQRYVDAIHTRHDSASRQAGT